MKVRSDKSGGVKGTDQGGARKARRADAEFGKLMADRVTEAPAGQGLSEVRESATTTRASAADAIAALGGVQAVESVQAVSPTSQEREQVMDKIDDVLTEWEHYAETLTRETNLKRADGVLDRIAGEVGDLKRRMDDEGAQGISTEELKSMVDELEVLAVTERFKFNRGDYSEL